MKEILVIQSLFLISENGIWYFYKSIKYLWYENSLCLLVDYCGLLSLNEYSNSKSAEHHKTEYHNFNEKLRKCS